MTRRPSFPARIDFSHGQPTTVRPAGAGSKVAPRAGVAARAPVGPQGLGMDSVAAGDRHRLRLPGGRGWTEVYSWRCMGGRLVAPMVTAAGQQALVVVDKTAQGLQQTVLEAVHFVPLKSGIA
jgi:hypothetical protein